MDRMIIYCVLAVQHINLIVRGLKLKTNKCIFMIITSIVYTSLGFIPAFKIKLAPLVEMSKYEAGRYYFRENFTHNWELKLMVALIIAIMVGILLRKRK